MSRQQKSAPVLVDENKALDIYFEALLREFPEQAEPMPVEPASPPPPVSPDPVTPVPAQQETVQTPPAQAAAPAQIPEWGRQGFQAMLFKVAGLTLAVPLAELSGVQEWMAERVTPLPNHVSWYLGLTPYRDHNAPIVDTAWLVLPEERLAQLNAPDERLQRIVFIDNGRWGLACDELAEVITLEPEQVRWRSGRTTRTWLAGTVIEHMCALIDPSAFARMLASGVEDAGIDLDAEQP